jgi:citrate lyase subunit beta / citryl-CoA lyase
VKDSRRGQRLAGARSFLFVPGDRPERFGKAAAAGADAVVIDLEDAVPPAHKEMARAAAAGWLARGNEAVVRVNGVRTSWHSRDVETLAAPAGALMIPKAESAGDWPAARGCLILPLIETANGLMNARWLLAAPGVVRPAFGSLDLAAELGVDPGDRTALLWARSHLVMAAAAAGVAAPIDGVTTSLDDPQALAADVRACRALGMTAKLCIHPSQVGTVHALLSPTEDEVTWARGVVAAAGDGVSAVGGHMVDPPVIARAHQVLARRRD